MLLGTQTFSIDCLLQALVGNGGGDVPAAGPCSIPLFGLTHVAWQLDIQHSHLAASLCVIGSGGGDVVVAAHSHSQHPLFRHPLVCMLPSTWQGACLNLP